MYRTWFGRMMVVMVAATIATTSIHGPAGAASGTVVTRTGVVTHGSIKTTQSTIGWLLTCALSHRTPPMTPLLRAACPVAHTCMISPAMRP